MSLEHVWPQSVGGANAPNVFKTRDVCKRCNEACGLYVDGAFLKSWFISQERGRSAYEYLDPQKPSPAPFWYMGEDTEFPVKDGDICERWLGLAGEQVYHLHERDGDHWSPFAGGNMIRRKEDPGRVYVFLTSPTEYWSLIALWSLIKQFPNATRRCLTVVQGLPRIPVSMPNDPPASDDEAREAAWIFSRGPGRHNHKISMKIDFSDRFLAKLSLGLGHTILGGEFASSPYASELRSLLWARTPEQRSNVNVTGSGWWSGAEGEMPDLLKWSGVWTLLLSAIPNAFGMSLTTPGGRSLSMMISDDPTVWSPSMDASYLQGKVFIFVPARDVCVGPISAVEFVSHRLGQVRHSQLADLERMRTPPEMLPSKLTSAPSSGIKEEHTPGPDGL